MPPQPEKGPPVRKRKSTSGKGPQRRKSGPRPPAIIIKWSGLKPMNDYWGKEWSRAFQLDTLTSAIESRVGGKNDRFVVPSIQRQLGPSPLVSIRFELVQENTYQLIFRIRAVNTRKKRGSFRLVVAKNDKDFTQITSQEYRHLQWLHERIPNLAVQPLRSEKIFLPDRHRRKEKDRILFGYITRWPTGYQELGIRRDLRFIKNIDPPITFDRKEDDGIKRRIIEIILRSYDPGQRTCIELPQVAMGDFAVSHSGAGQPRVKLVSCRRLVTDATTERLMHSILTGRWKWGERQFNIVPSEADDFVQAMHNALGKKEANVWFERYRIAVKKKRFKNSPIIPIDQLEPFFE